MDYTAVGDTTNVAARLQQMGEPGRVTISEATYRLIQGYFDTRRIGDLHLKGKAEPVSAWEVTGEHETRTRLEVESERGLTPFVGRERELGVLLDAFERACAGEGQAVFLVGGDAPTYDLRESAPPDEWDPELSLIYTPNLPMPGYPDDRLIAVDLEAGVTRIMNSDYFGESKKGGLRMWNALVYERGGLAMHAGCKVVPTDAGERTMLIIGLSGTGKTTTTFTRQNNSQPVQDDFIGLFAGGKVVGTENGCFAKTFGLDPAHEPAIYGAVVKPDAYLENASQQEDGGPVDFFDTTYTKNGRATFPMSSLGIWRDPREIGPVNHLLILNRNDNIIPAVARLTREQAAAYFMLGETQGTSAGGAAEEGRAMRVPGTNPFYPHRDEQQANRFHDLMGQCDFDVFLLNTGRVGGKEGDANSKKVAIEHSGAIVKAIAEGTISWEQDPDFGYDVASALPGIDDLELLQPRLLYERTGRAADYADWVARLKRERIAFLEGFPGLFPEILAAVS